MYKLLKIFDTWVPPKSNFRIIVTVGLTISQAIEVQLGILRYLQNPKRISNVSGQCLTGFEEPKALKSSSEAQNVTVHPNCPLKELGRMA